MAKGYYLALGALALSLLGQPADAVAAPTKEDSIRTELAKVYTSQVGVTEKGCDNCGPEVKRYLASSGNRQGEPWCGAFVCWVFKQLGLKVPAGAGAARNWFPTSKVIYSRGKPAKQRPKRGDCAGFYYAHLGRIGHVGFIDQWGDDYVVTVEGNTGGGVGVNRNGGGVHKMRRLRSQISVVSSWVPKS
jgi:CHAP domain